MDHSGMHHGDMDMGDGEPMCNMNMLFTWDYTNLCIIFKQWHITGLWSLLLSLLAVAALTAGYEAVREASRRYEASLTGAEDKRDDSARGRSARASGTEGQVKIVKAGFYAVQVFYSFFIMLLFMTYNGWVMLSVAAGAFAGYLIFGGSSATKSVACH